MLKEDDEELALPLQHSHLSILFASFPGIGSGSPKDVAHEVRDPNDEEGSGEGSVH